MTPQRLRQVKREIRVLGVAAKRDRDGYTIVGIVYRGNQWLDGALRGHSDGDDLTRAVADMLAGSPHSGQVRVILLSRDTLPSEAIVSTEELYAQTGRPVILLGDASGHQYTWKNGLDRTIFSARGVGRWTAEAVLRASTREGATPEALRVASLTLTALAEGLDA